MNYACELVIRQQHLNYAVNLFSRYVLLVISQTQQLNMLYAINLYEHEHEEDFYDWIFVFLFW